MFIPIDKYFSVGLKPPTSDVCILLLVVTRGHHSVDMALKSAKKENVILEGWKMFAVNRRELIGSCDFGLPKTKSDLIKKEKWNPDAMIGKQVEQLI